MKSKTKSIRFRSSATSLFVATREIARRATAIWQKKGCVEGRDLENWLEAEKQLYDKAGKRNKVFTAPKTMFDENHNSTHEVDKHLQEITPPARDHQSPTSL